mmetsp:Transcript_31566/g.74082  ORF Transcript_31566/g.74082 Transcript_31566/m.74082 type:complete len:156 (+) Transcript_31566:44-511(+)
MGVDKNREAIAAAGGIKAVVEGMKAHEGSAGVQEQGCGALVNLAINDKNKEAIAAAGGIEAVVEGMKAHKGSAGVQEQGCGALLNLADKNGVRWHGGDWWGDCTLHCGRMPRPVVRLFLWARLRGYTRKEGVTWVQIRTGRLSRLRAGSRQWWKG